MTHPTDDHLRQRTQNETRWCGRCYRESVACICATRPNALAAAPQPAPDREALVQVIREASSAWSGHELRGSTRAEAIADALLAAGYRKADPLADERETLAWAVEVDGDVVWVDAGMGQKRDVAEIVAEEEGGKPVRVAIRVVEDEA